VDGDVAVDGEADEVVEDVAEEEPGEDEDGEGDVAGGGVAGVFEDFCALESVSVRAVPCCDE